MERKLSKAEKEEVFDVFYSVGNRMDIKGLPGTFDEWEEMRERQLHKNLQRSCYTNDLFRKYRKHLGFVRYRVLIETQTLIVPQSVRKMLGFRRFSLLKPFIGLYKISRKTFHLNIKLRLRPWICNNEIEPLDFLCYKFL